MAVAGRVVWLVAVTEALEGIVRAVLGKNCCDNLATAVTEALEVALRARLGKNCCDNLAVAVTEALEDTVRAQFGKKLLIAWHRNIAAQKRQNQTPKSQKQAPSQTKGIPYDRQETLKNPLYRQQSRY